MKCVDASIGVKWVIAEEYSAQAAELVVETSSAGNVLIAPPLMPSEVTNTVRQRMRREGLSLVEGDLLLAHFLAYPVTLVAPNALYRLALNIAETYNLQAAYDAEYVALAQLFGCELWTDDRKLIKAVGHRLTFVKWIGNYPVGQSA